MERKQRCDGGGRLHRDRYGTPNMKEALRGEKWWQWWWQWEWEEWCKEQREKSTQLRSTCTCNADFIEN